MPSGELPRVLDLFCAFSVSESALLAAISPTTSDFMLSFPASNWDQQFSVSRQAFTAKTFPRTASRITPRLYLSDCWTARDAEKLAKLGITHIVSIMEQDPKTPDTIPERNRLALTLADHPTADILPILDLTTSFIGAALEENTTNKVLVHCVQGISRSATVMCAYLISTSNLDGPGAISHLQSLRGIVCPNSGFRAQLDEYAATVVRRKPKPSYKTLLIPGVLKFSHIVMRAREPKGSDTLKGHSTKS